MYDNSCWWEVKPLHNNIGIFSKFLNKFHSFIYFVTVKKIKCMHMTPTSSFLCIFAIRVFEMLNAASRHFHACLKSFVNEKVLKQLTVMCYSIPQNHFIHDHFGYNMTKPATWFTA